MTLRLSCQCGKVLIADERHAGKSARCPHCQTLVRIPTPAEKQQPRPSTSAAPQSLPEIMRANRKLAGRQCPICAAPILLGDEVRNCLNCQQCYHVACWRESEGCATYGCASAPITAKTALGPSAAGQSAVVSASLPVRNSSRKGMWLALTGSPVLVVLLLAIAVFIVNHVRLQSPLNQVLVEDGRNSGVRVSCHYGY